MEKIKKLMDKEHNRILEFLNQLESNLSSKHLLDKFQKVKWNLEKHFLTEETAIFNMFQTMNEEEVPNDFNLLEEHVEIMQLVKILEKDLEQKNKDKLHQEFNEIKNRLIKHTQFEDKFFYPELDKQLSPEQKIKIINKAKEIISG